MSRKDYERLKLAIECMWAYTYSKHEMISRANVLELIELYVEKLQEDEEEK